MKTKTKRLFFIDNLRIAIAVLVVIHHAGQAYGPGGWWYFESDERSNPLGVLFTLNRSFFMSLFFLVSGYFLPGAFNRKGASRFLRERFIRLGIPLLLFFFLIIPMLMYVYYINFRGLAAISFFDYYKQIYFGFAPMPANWTGPSWPDMQFGHLWFVEHLLVYSLAYAAYRALPFKRRNSDRLEPPSNISIAVFAVLLALLTSLVRLVYPIDVWIGLLGFIQVAFADVPRDLSFFIIGIIAYQHDWLRRFPSKQGFFWLSIGIALAFVPIVLNATGNLGNVFGRGGSSLVYTLWEAFYCCGISFGLIVLFRDRLEHSSKLLATLAAASYAVYLFHVPVVVMLQYALANISLQPFVKFLLVSIIGVLLTFAFSSFIRRIHIVKKVL